MHINAHLVSHLGRVREKNEDNFYFYGAVLENINEAAAYSGESATDQPSLFGVYDGMGGISAGEIASRIAADTARNVFRNVTENTGDYERVLGQICQAANDAICREMRETVKKRMGSTAAMLLFYRDRFVLCNIGDSPIFILRNARMVKISKDHTERENYEKVYGAAAENKKFRLTQHLGIFREEMLIEPNIVLGQSKSRDRFLICSDGLTDMVSASEIESVLCAGLSAAETANKLQQTALDNGGKDNITVICIDITA